MTQPDINAAKKEYKIVVNENAMQTLWTKNVFCPEPILKDTMGVRDVNINSSYVGENSIPHCDDPMDIIKLENELLRSSEDMIKSYYNYGPPEKKSDGKKKKKYKTSTSKSAKKTTTPTTKPPTTNTP